MPLSKNLKSKVPWIGRSFFLIDLKNSSMSSKVIATVLGSFTLDLLSKSTTITLSNL